MTSLQQIKERIVECTPLQFEEIAMQLFYEQAEHNTIYKAYLKALNRNIKEIQEIKDIPFLPIDFFKTHKVQTHRWDAETTFTSSGTTGTTTSRHYVASLAWYETIFRQAFESFYGDVQSYAVVALLPAYLERKGSSLVYMAQKMIEESKHSLSDFYLYDQEKLVETLQTLEKEKQPTILLGVSFALLDLAEKYTLNLKHTIVMETGGMKGRRREMVRAELHDILQKGLGVQSIHSEYGMTELMSQAYSKGEGKYMCPSWMKVMTREVNDPFAWEQNAKTGIINIIDLANVDSCAFIATADLGRVFDNGSFEVLGRMDYSDARGCNLMYFS